MGLPPAGVNDRLTQSGLNRFVDAVSEERYQFGLIDYIIDA